MIITIKVDPNTVRVAGYETGERVIWTDMDGDEHPSRVCNLATVHADQLHRALSEVPVVYAGGKGYVWCNPDCVMRP